MNLKFWLGRVLGVAFIFALVSCASMPSESHKKHGFPELAFREQPPRKFERLGTVRSKVNFPAYEAKDNFDSLCRNYFNLAAQRLIDQAKKNGGQAVMEVRSVVFLLDGKVELHKDGQCTDEGAEGQVLAQGVAIKWLPDDPKESVGPKE